MLKVARRIVALARLELLRLIRSRTTFSLLVMVPAFQVLLFGYAIRPDTAQLSIAIAAPTAASADSIAARLRREPGLVIVERRFRPGEAAAAVKAGDVLIGVEVPPLRSIANPFEVQRPLSIIVDATSAALTSKAVARIEALYWRELVDRSDMAESGPGIAVSRLYNPLGRADWTFLPALIGVTVMIAMVMLGSLGVAREREVGVWEGLQALPVTTAETLAGKMLPYMVIGTVQGASVLAIAIFLFGVPARGSVTALVVLLPVFAAGHFTLGYAISTRCNTQLAALQGAVAFYLPAMLLSGFLYPFETLPRWAQTIGSAFPLTHFIRAARASLLQGKDAADILVHGWPMLVFLAVAVAFALLPRRLRLD